MADRSIALENARGSSMKQFEQLGNLVGNRWKRAGSKTDQFSAIATHALQESRIFRNVDPDEVVDWLGSTRNLPRQFAKEFGQPGINVYMDENFYIQVLFWLDSTTAIHAHSFAGAFGVLKGSSLHSRYEFAAGKPGVKEFLLGDVKFLYSEVLQKGDVRTIEPGKGLIHSLFHLDEPSVSIVVRTMPCPGPEPQYTFIKPHIAIDPLDVDTGELTKLKMLESLRRIDVNQMWKFCRLAVVNCRTWMLFHVLLEAHRSANSAAEEWEGLIEVSRNAHDRELVDSIVASVVQENLSRRLMALRCAVRDPDHRFFLGLLVNVPTRSSLLQLVSKKYGSQDPGQLVAQWLREMSASRELWARFAPELFEVLGSPLLHNTVVDADLNVANSVGAGSTAN